MRIPIISQLGHVVCCRVGPFMENGAADTLGAKHDAEMFVAPIATRRNAREETLLFILRHVGNRSRPYSNALGPVEACCHCGSAAGCQPVVKKKRGHAAGFTRLQHRNLGVFV